MQRGTLKPLKVLCRDLIGLTVISNLGKAQLSGTDVDN